MSESTTMGAVHIGATIPGGRSISSKIDEDLAHLLNHLLHLGYDLTGAYKTALARVQSLSFKESLIALGDSNMVHIQELSCCVENLGKTPTHRGDLHGLLERGRVILGDLNGDEGILKAMAANEEEMCSAYKDALSHPGMPVEIGSAIARALAHQTRNCAVYDRLLGRFVG